MGHPPLDPFILGGSVGSAELLSTNCFHSANCVFPQQLSFLLKRSGGPCGVPITFTPPLYRPNFPTIDDNGWDIFQLMEGEWELVTSKIIF
jgi:hypothetical protein